MVRPGGALYGDYQRPEEFEAAWRELSLRLGGRESIAGHSVEGRPLWRFDLGSTDADAPVVLLTALIHGVELIGAVALMDAVRRFASLSGVVGERARLVVMPILNPDGLVANMDRLARGKAAFQRRNANGVDLNRNFPSVSEKRIWHPCAGSSWKASPYYRGPRPFSEPETQAVRDVVAEVRPTLSLGFHSFGNSLLFPWAHSRERNPRYGNYVKLADSFLQTLPSIPYRCRQAISLYPTLGDLDDWLDATYGSVAYTVEVSGLDNRLLHPLRFINPFCWMNPSRIEPTVANLSPAIASLIGASLLPALT